MIFPNGSWFIIITVNGQMLKILIFASPTTRKSTFKPRLKHRPKLGNYGQPECKMGDNRSLNSFEGNKKVKGIKRHIVADKKGSLLSIMVTAATVYNSKAVEF